MTVPRRSGRRRRRWGLLFVLLVSAGLVALFIQSRREPPTPVVPTNFAAGAESLNAAERRHDWGAAEQWAERLAAEQPRNFQVLYSLALSLHNHATAMTPRFNRPRPALRLSLDRIAAEARVMALLDSAARMAATPDDWARAELLHGMAFEGLGFPIEALERFGAVNRRLPNLGGPVLRLHWVSAHLADPRLPDVLAMPESEAPAPSPVPAAPGPSEAPPPAPGATPPDSTTTPAPSSPTPP